MKNIDIVRHFIEEQANRGDLSLYDEIFTEDVCLYGPARRHVVKGIGALKKSDHLSNLFYPEKKFKIVEIFAYGDQVFVRWTCNAIYKEGYKGIRPKKEALSINGVTLYRLEKGKICEIRRFWDRLSIREQIAEVPIRSAPVEPGYYSELLIQLGLEECTKKVSRLTKRERECLKLLLQGKTSKETSAALELSPRTVESYFENMKKKLKCYNKGELFTTAQLLEKLELL